MLIPILNNNFPFLFISSRDGTGPPVPATAGVIDVGAGTGVFFATAPIVVIAIVGAASGRGGRGGRASSGALQGLKGPDCCRRRRRRRPTCRRRRVRSSLSSL